MTWWAWLFHGSNDLVLPQSWLDNRERLRGYTAYTMRQLQQGRVVSDVETMRRRDFWRHIAEKRSQARVTPFGKRA